MTIRRNQSALKELADQLILDRADGKYLNVVTSNLGLQRPPFGFSDDTWRAIVKIIALQYKQIRTKFEEVLSVILGPKITQCGALLQDVSAGDKTALLVDSKQFPQVGFMVIDEGLSNEETAEYCFIDRYTHRVYFNDPLIHSHTAVGQEWETGIISPVQVSSTNINVFNSSGFPDPVIPYTICVGRGTEYEQVGAIDTVNQLARYITTSFNLNLGGSGLDAIAGKVVNQTTLSSQINTFYLTLEDISALSSIDGYLQTELDETFTATGGTTTDVTVTGPLTEEVYGGFWVRFTGNITPTLTNLLAYVTTNDSTTLFFDNTLPDPPNAGDEFVVLSNFQYIRVSDVDQSVLMHVEFPDLLTLAASAELTVIRPTTTCAIAQIQVKGTGWDVLQSDPRHVEILLPNDFLTNDLRSASYIRETGLVGLSDADDNRAVGDTDVSVVTTESLPVIGVLEHVEGAVRYAYYNPHTYTTAEFAVGATSISVLDTSLFDPSGTIQINGNLILYTVLDSTTLSTAPLPAAVRPGTIVRDEHIFKLARPLEVNVNIGHSLDFYASYDSGDIWNVEDVWPGPYVWDLFAEIHKKETVPGNSVTTFMSGPTTLDIDKEVNATILEVTDASTFPTSVPYNILLGENSGNIETLAVQEISLKSRTYEDTAADVNPGDLSVTMASLAGPTGPANTFPSGVSYRVVIEPFTADSEVLEVIGTATGPDRFLLNTAAIGTHASGSQIVLLSDLLRVSPALGDDHLGKIPGLNKLELYGPEIQTDFADLVRPLYTNFSLNLAGTNFPVENGTAIFNFGNRVLKATGKLVSIAGSVLTLDSTNTFPTTGYPYTIYLDVGAGPLLQEVLHVTNNNTGTDQLTVSHPPVFLHVAGRLVEFRPGSEEIISYNSRTAGVLSFNPYLLINNTHHEVEFLAPSVGTGFPRIDGFDFPLRIPVSLEDKLNFIIELIRAAGVQVTYISKL